MTCLRWGLGGVREYRQFLPQYGTVFGTDKV